MPWRLPRWAAITLPVAVTLKRFLAPDLVFSLGIWLSCCRRKNAPKRRAFAAEMLVRALKVLSYFVNAIAARASTRQPLISRAMRVRLWQSQAGLATMNRGTPSTDVLISGPRQRRK